MKKRLMCLLCGFGSIVSHAQQIEMDSIQLSEVVVSSLKKPSKEAYVGKQITSIDAKQLKMYAGETVGSILNKLSGIVIQGSQGPLGSNQSIYARGGRAKQVLILIDGVRVADPYSASLSYDLRFLNVDQIESIEIIKGANSTLYGSNAATAVIAITTKKSTSKDLAINFQSSIGTQQTAVDQNYNLSEKEFGTNIAGRFSSINYYISANTLHTKGVSMLDNTTEEDPFSQSSFKVALSNDRLHKLYWELSVKREEFSSNYDDSFLLEDADYRYQSNLSNASVRLNYRMNKGTLNVLNSNNYYRFTDVSTYGGTYYSKSNSLDMYYKIPFDKHWSSLMGIQYTSDASESIANSSYQITDPYLNLVYQSKQFQFNSGIRLNHHSVYNNHWIAHFNPSYSFDLGASKYVFYTSIGSSYITPTLFQLYGQWGANPSLKPEENKTVELGIKSFDKRLKWNLTLYKRFETNAVYWNNSTFGYDNSIGESISRGVEYSADFRLNDIFTLNSIYTYTLREAEVAIRIPKHKTNINFSCELSEKSRLNLSSVFIGKRLDTDFTNYNNVSLDSYNKTDLSWNYQANKALSFTVSVRNLLNAKYIEQLHYSTLGRNINMRLSYDL